MFVMKSYISAYFGNSVLARFPAVFAIRMDRFVFKRRKYCIKFDNSFFLGYNCCKYINNI